MIDLRIGGDDADPGGVAAVVVNVVDDRIRHAVVAPAQVDAVAGAVFDEAVFQHRRPHQGNAGILGLVPPAGLKRELRGVAGLQVIDDDPRGGGVGGDRRRDDLDSVQADVAAAAQVKGVLPVLYFDQVGGGGIALWRADVKLAGGRVVVELAGGVDAPGTCQRGNNCRPKPGPARGRLPGR